MVRHLFIQHQRIFDEIHRNRRASIHQCINKQDSCFHPCLDRPNIDGYHESVESVDCVLNQMPVVFVHLDQGYRFMFVTRLRPLGNIKQGCAKWDERSQPGTSADVFLQQECGFVGGFVVDIVNMCGNQFLNHVGIGGGNVGNVIEEVNK